MKTAPRLPEVSSHGRFESNEGCLTDDGLYGVVRSVGVERELHSVPDYITEQLEALDYYGFGLQAVPLQTELMHQLGLEGLPREVAVVGGAARALLQQTLFAENAPVRDVDLAVVSDFVSGDEDKRYGELARQYMPDDYAHGHGIPYESLACYFTTRDFTINEVIVIGGTIIATSRAIDDLRHKVIRPTEYESDGWPCGIGPKLLMKAELMTTVYDEMYGQSHCEGFTVYNVDPFYEALALNKAMQYGLRVAIKFLGRIGYDCQNADDVISIARGLGDSCEFVYRGSPLAELVSNDDADFEGEVPDEYRSAESMMFQYAGRLPMDLQLEGYL